MIANARIGPLAAIRNERRHLGELIVSAVALAVAADLAAQWVGDSVGHTLSLIFGVALLAIILSLLLLTRPRRRD